MQITLRDTMDKKGKSIYALNKETGVASSTISNLCNNKTTGVRFDVLDKICDALDCEISDILVPDKTPKGDTFQ